MVFLEKKIFEKQENKIEKQRNIISNLKNELLTVKDSLEIISNENLSCNYFTLQGNENAMSYVEKLGFESLEIESLVSEYMYDQNLIKEKIGSERPFDDVKSGEIENGTAIIVDGNWCYWINKDNKVFCVNGTGKSVFDVSNPECEYAPIKSMFHDIEKIVK